MALQKSRQFNNVNINYWKISGINITHTGEMAQIFIMGFLNEEKRQEGIENKIAFENYICKDEDFKNYFRIEKLDEVNPVSSAYKYLKEKVKVFAEAIDV